MCPRREGARDHLLITDLPTLMIVSVKHLAIAIPGELIYETEDLLALQIVQLKLVPRMLIGHSFGGKVALSMVEQAKKPLAQPVQVNTR